MTAGKSILSRGRCHITMLLLTRNMLSCCCCCSHLPASFEHARLTGTDCNAAFSGWSNTAIRQSQCEVPGKHEQMYSCGRYALGGQAGKSLICMWCPAYPCVIKIRTPEPSLNLGQTSQSSGKLLAVLAEAVLWTFMTCPNFGKELDVPILMTNGY